MFKAALALSFRMFSHELVCEGAAEHLGVCTSVMDCPWLRWLEVSWRHATFTHGNQGALSPRGFPVSAGSQISFRDRVRREEEHIPEPCVCVCDSVLVLNSTSNGVGYKVLKRQEGEWIWKEEHPEQVRK